MERRAGPAQVHRQAVEAERYRALGDLPAFLRDLRARRHLSHRAVATRAGIDHSTASRIVGGSREPSLSTALAIVDAFLPFDVELAHSAPGRSLAPMRQAKALAIQYPNSVVAYLLARLDEPRDRLVAAFGEEPHA